MKPGICESRGIPSSLKNFLAWSKSSIVLLATTAYIRTSLVMSLDGTPWGSPNIAEIQRLE